MTLSRFDEIGNDPDSKKAIFDGKNRVLMKLRMTQKEKKVKFDEIGNVPDGKKVKFDGKICVLVK